MSKIVGADSGVDIKKRETLSPFRMKRAQGYPDFYYGTGGGGVGVPGQQYKRPRREGHLEVRLLIPSAHAGSIIGKGGGNISKMRTDTGARVLIYDCPGPERIMSVQADGVDTAIKVVELTLPFLGDDPTPPGGPAPDAAAAGEGDEKVEIRMLIHQSIVGGVIGRGGEKIKEIRETSGAFVKAFKECAPCSTDRCISITGVKDNVAVAFRDVLTIVAATDALGHEEQYDPINFDCFYAGEYGGFGTEQNYETYLNPMRGRGRGRGRGHAMADRGRGRGGFGGMNGGGGGFGGGPFSGPPSGFGGRGGFGGFSRGGFGGDLGRGRMPFGRGGSDSMSMGGDTEIRDPFAENALDEAGEEEEKQVTIPAHMAGAIIGPRGTRIRMVRAETTTNIKIAEPEEGSDERTITITGTPRRIERACKLLQQCVREHMGERVVGGGGGGIGHSPFGGSGWRGYEG